MYSSLLPSKLESYGRNPARNEINPKTSEFKKMFCLFKLTYTKFQQMGVVLKIH